MLNKDLLKMIVSENADILNDMYMFKTLISIHFSNDIVKKNLLSISYDEKIPHIISNQKKYSAFEEKILVNKLVDSCACNEDKAKELIYLWEYAYSVDAFFLTFFRDLIILMKF